MNADNHMTIITACAVAMKKANYPTSEINKVCSSIVELLLSNSLTDIMREANKIFKECLVEDGTMPKTADIIPFAKRT